jgi:hypothetical protein
MDIGGFLSYYRGKVILVAELTISPMYTNEHDEESCETNFPVTISVFFYILNSGATL